MGSLQLIVDKTLSQTNSFQNVQNVNKLRGLYVFLVTDMIATCGETTGVPALRYMLSQMQTHPVGQQILR